MTMPTQEATTSVHLLNKKRSTRISAASSDSVQSLKAQVKRLEKQREFLTLWKADVLNGFNLEASYVDVKLQACDGTPVFAHKAVLVSFFFFFFFFFCLYLPALSLVLIISFVRLYSVHFAQFQPHYVQIPVVIQFDLRKKNLVRNESVTIDAERCQSKMPLSVTLFLCSHMCNLLSGRIDL